MLSIYMCQGQKSPNGSLVPIAHHASIRHNATRTEAAFEAQAKNTKEPEVDTAFFPR